MSDTSAVPSTDPSISAGQLLRSARETAGLHIVALAAALKVPVRKLEALEANRWEELTDATFVRALAGSVARHLKIDAAPILQALPTSKAVPIEIPENLGRASGTNFQFGFQSGVPTVAWLVLSLLLAALLLYVVPDTVFKQLTSYGAGASKSDVPASKAFSVAVGDAHPGVAGPDGDGAAQGKGVIEQPESTTKSAVVPSDKPIEVSVAPASVNGAATQVSSSTLTIKATADTWIDVNGQDGKPRAQRLLKSGDTAEFNDSPTFAVVIGNASGAKVWVNGQAFDLSPVARNNVARFDVK